MDDNDIILVMAICKLMGKDVTEKDVEKEFQIAWKRLNQSRRATN
jgi:hypothetical protein